MAQNILESVIEAQYLDNGNFDVFIKLPVSYDGGPASLLVDRVEGLNAFLVEGNSMRTPEISVSAYVTKKQDSLLRHLYAATVRPGYIDQRYPIRLEWGDTSKMEFAKPSSDDDGLLDGTGMEAHEFYLASYKPIEQVAFDHGNLHPVSLVLRMI